MLMARIFNECQLRFIGKEKVKKQGSQLTARTRALRDNLYISVLCLKEYITPGKLKKKM